MCDNAICVVSTICIVKIEAHYKLQTTKLWHYDWLRLHGGCSCVQLALDDKI